MPHFFFLQPPTLLNLILLLPQQILISYFLHLNLLIIPKSLHPLLRQRVRIQVVLRRKQDRLHLLHRHLRNPIDTVMYQTYLQR